MSVPLDDRTRALSDATLRGRVQAGMFSRLFLAYDAVANDDATLQDKRLQLCSAVTSNPDAYVTQFLWVVLSRTTKNTVDAIDDTEIGSVLNQGNWDEVADLLIPPVVGGA